MKVQRIQRFQKAQCDFMNDNALRKTVPLSIHTRQEVADFLFNNPPQLTTVYEFWARWTGEGKLSEISIDSIHVLLCVASK